MTEFLDGLIDDDEHTVKAKSHFNYPDADDVAVDRVTEDF